MRRVARLEAATAVERVMSLHCYLTAGGRWDEVMELFAQRRPEVSAEFADWGVFVGHDHVRRVVVDAPVRLARANGAAARRLARNETRDDRAGLLCENALMTPLVQVSPAATAARGLWMVLGATTERDEDGALHAVWTWVQFSAEFVVEEGEWRILHLRVAPRFRTLFRRSWAETAAVGPVKPPPGLVPPSDRPPTGERTDYALDAPPPYDPPAPEPYPSDGVDETIAPGEEDLGRRLVRLEDVRAIVNLMSLHEYLHVANRNGEEFERCFARRTAGVAFEPEDWGVWEGREAIKASYVDGAPPALPGLVTEHATTTGVVEVAADGRTAKGVWISPGHETFPGPEGSPLALWSWGRYGIDFVKEDGEWKFWHFHIYTTFRTPYGVDWVSAAVDPAHRLFPEGEMPPGMPTPSRPVTFNQPYHPERAPVLQPTPPSPYPTFDEAQSYCPAARPLGDT
jgi:hypothetical protein